MTATQSLQSIYRQSLSATVLCWLIDRVPGPTKSEWLGLLGAALRVVAVVLVATCVAWATCALVTYYTAPVHPLMDPRGYWVMKGVMMLLASWSAIRCLRLSRHGSTAAAFANAGLSGLVASFVFARWCWPLVA